MINEIKQSLTDATQGKWDFAVFEDSRHVIYDDTYFNRHIAEIVRGGVESEQREEDNARLIANAPEWLRYLIDEVERLNVALYTHKSYDKTVAEFREENEKMRNVLKNIRTHYISVYDGDWKKAYDEIWNMALMAKEGKTK